jgi:hypothetical protein
MKRLFDGWKPRGGLLEMFPVKLIAAESVGR